MALSGFKYYWDRLGLDDESYLVHYDFRSSGNFVPSVANPLFSGTFEGGLPAGFWNVSGSGQFGTGVVDVQNATGLVSAFWTHFFIYERNQRDGGILFSSLETSPGRTAGYILGVTDNNRLYFEHAPQGLPVVKVSHQIYGEKNAVAIVKAGDVLTFHNYNFDTKQLQSESFTLATYDEESFSASIGGAVNAPTYIQNKPFKGFIDEYVFVTEALIPSNVRTLFSGFYSEYREEPTVIGTSGYYQVTGFQYVTTGVTGITGYSTTATFSGVDNFGDDVYTVTQTPQTGYLVSGLVQVPLSGYIEFSITGDIAGHIVVDELFGQQGFGMTEISYLSKPTGTGYYLTTSTGDKEGRINLRADYDRVVANFEMSRQFAPETVSVYLDGALLASGDYTISGFRMGISGDLTEANVVIYDVLSGLNLQPYINTGVFVPLQAFERNTSRLFVDGVRQLLGINYLENTSLDLLGPSGLFETGLNLIYNDDDNFIER